MRITTVELIYLNTMAKLLKQKNFVVLNNLMIGIDNLETYLIYQSLDNTILNDINNGYIINTRELSAFVKSISIESYFDLINDRIISNTGEELVLIYDFRMLKQIEYKYNYAMKINYDLDINNTKVINENEINDIANILKSMKKSDGQYNFIYNNYYMTIAPNILNMNKTDKLYITIYKNNIQPNIFTAKYRISKKSSDIILFITFLNV